MKNFLEKKSIFFSVFFFGYYQHHRHTYETSPSSTVFLGFLSASTASVVVAVFCFVSIPLILLSCHHYRHLPISFFISLLFFFFLVFLFFLLFLSSFLLPSLSPLLSVFCSSVFSLQLKFELLLLLLFSLTSKRKKTIS